MAGGFFDLQSANQDAQRAETVQCGLRECCTCGCHQPGGENYDRAPQRVRPCIHERPRPYRPEVCPGCSWSAIEEDVHRPGTRPCRSGTPRAQGSASRLNKPHLVMRLRGNVAMNSHDIKTCKPAKAAPLPQPASSHAVGGTPGHERVSSATAARKQDKEPPATATATNKKGPRRGPSVNSFVHTQRPTSP